MLTLASATLGSAWLAMRTFVPALGITKWLRIAGAILIACVSLYGGIRLSTWWHSDKLTQKEAKLQCNTVMLLAAHNARESALRRLSLALKQRADVVASDESRIKEEERILKETRDATQKDDSTSVCVADDGWLRRYQKR